jgi:DNA polymerase-3 subunit delta'
VREIRNDAFMQPNEADYKIYILGNCQGMSESAQNAILKILEEPPAYAIFILTVTNKSALLETVLSRCVVMTVDKVDARTSANYICKVNPEIDYDTAYNASMSWNGNIGKALESLGEGKLSAICTYANDIANALLAENEYELLKACSVFKGDRATLVATLTMLKTMFRDAMLVSTGDVLSGQADTVKLLSSRLNREKLIRLITSTDNIRVLAEKNGNNAILITKICYDLRRAIGR